MFGYPLNDRLGPRVESSTSCSFSCFSLGGPKIYDGSLGVVFANLISHSFLGHKEKFVC